MITEIACPPNYDLLSSVHAWIYPDIQPVPEVTGVRYLTRAFTFNKCVMPVRIEQGEQKLSISCPSDIDPDTLLKKVTYVLGLDVDWRKGLEIIQKYESISGLETKMKSLRPYSTDTAFEGLMKTIIQQQVSYRAANMFTKRFVESLGHVFDFNGQLVYSFPSSKAIIEAGQKRLRDLGLGYKARCIIDVCEHIESGALVLDDKSKNNLDAIQHKLLPIRGIGIWTIQTLAIAALQNFSVFPFSDLGVQNLLGNLFNNGMRLTTKEVEEMSKSWGNAGPIALYLLMCADVLGWFGDLGRPKMPKR